MSWSDRISDRYQCKLAGDLADWFDREIWKREGTGEFRIAVSPQSLLTPSPVEFWPGLMPCDLIPLLGDSAGNWVCARVDRDQFANEIVHWFHGGGDWIHWGNRLSDAIVFEAVVDRLPGPHRRLAIPAENPRRYFDPLSDPLVDWAFEHQGKAVRELLSEQTNASETADALIEERVAVVAVRCELIQELMHQPWSAGLTPAHAAKLGLDWNRCIEWMFDPSRIPTQEWSQLKTLFSLKDSDRREHDWSQIKNHCERVQEVAPETAWGWDLSGYSCERLGHIDEAIETYQSGASCSIFSDQAVRLNSHWTQSIALKFSVARLQEISPKSVESSVYLSKLISRTPDTCRQNVFSYWVEQARTNEEPAFSLDFLMKAGWDVGVDSIQRYGVLLDSIVAKAIQAGEDARSAVASTHRNCLRDRYGI